MTRSELEAEVARLRHIIAGHEKAAALMNAGMESQCELMDAMKQSLREAQAEVARLGDAFTRLRADREAMVEHMRKGGDL
jgi:chromosome segregation ATPase